MSGVHYIILFRICILRNLKKNLFLKFRYSDVSGNFKLIERYFFLHIFEEKNFEVRSALLYVIPDIEIFKKRFLGILLFGRFWKF